MSFVKKKKQSKNTENKTIYLIGNLTEIWLSISFIIILWIASVPSVTGKVYFISLRYIYVNKSSVQYLIICTMCVRYCALSVCPTYAIIGASRIGQNWTINHIPIEKCILYFLSVSVQNNKLIAYSHNQRNCKFSIVFCLMDGNFK